MRLHGASVVVLQHLDPLVLEPIDHGAVFVSGDARHVGFAGLDLPVDPILRAQIVRDASAPVVDDHVVLDRRTPDDGVFEVARDRWVHSFVGHLIVGRDPRLAEPDSTTTAHHQIRAVLTPGEGEIGEALDDPPVPWVEFEPIFLPGTVNAVRDVVPPHDVKDISSIRELEHLRIVSRADGVLDTIRAGRTVGYGVNHDGTSPLVVAFF